MSPFKPAWWLPGPHLQTIWPTIVRRHFNHPFVRERFELHDGDFVDLFWSGQGSGPIVLILHGLEGSARSHYVQGLSSMLVKRGWRSVAMEFRGCSKDPNRLPRRYHSGDTADVEEVLLSIHKREPETPIFVVGYSMGGNVLLKWLGERIQHPVKAAVAVSVPFEIRKAAKRVEQGFSMIYLIRFLRSLIRNTKRIQGIEKMPIDLEKLNHIHNMREFDSTVTAPLYGFSDCEDYYQRCSSRSFLRYIHVPTLILHSIDDPLSTADSVPEHYELSPYIQLEVNPYGGHVGFVSGDWPWCPVYWLEHRIPEYLEEVLNARPPGEYQ